MVKNLPAKAGDIKDAGLIPEFGRSPGGGHGNPLQYSCLEHPWTEEQGRSQSMASHRVRNDQATAANAVKGFSVINETEVDVFLELSCFFYDPMDVGNFIFGSSAFSKSSLYTWKFSVHYFARR